MFWRIDFDECGPDAPAGADSPDGRFVLHRHTDEAGPHFDLRLEQEGYLAGWRIDGESLADAPWATEKRPHTLQWLDSDGDATREDAGTYAWLERGTRGGVLVLQGQGGGRIVRVSAMVGLPARSARAVYEAMTSCGVTDMDPGRLIEDGVAARRRAVERLCGLGRELDGPSFDEALWRRIAGNLTLAEIQGQLRTLEVRFDRKYPPHPVSRPETLREDDDGVRQDAALAILRE